MRRLDTTRGTARALGLAVAAVALAPGLAFAGDEPAATGQPLDASSPAIAWASIDDAPWTGEYDLVLTGAALAPDDSVVVSGGPLFGPTVVWRSTDVTDWLETPLPGGEHSLGTVTESPAGLVVLATELSSGAGLVWRSRNGAGWRKPTRTRRAEFASSEVVGDELVIGGNAGRPREPAPAMWSTANGRKLEKTGLSKLRKRGRVNGISATPSGRLLIETTTYLRDHPRLHLRRRGGDWLPVSPPGDLVAGSLASTATGAVLATSDGDESIIWHSPDAAEWTPVAEAGPVTGLVRSGAGAIALPQVLASRDGTEWCHTGFEPPADTVVRDAVALADGRLLVVGSGLVVDGEGRPRSVARAWVSSPLPAICDAVKVPARSAGLVGHETSRPEDGGPAGGDRTDGGSIRQSR